MCLPHLPFRDDKFSLIYALSVMTHTGYLQDMWLLELSRILRPGGVMVLTIHDEETIEYYKEHGQPSWIPKELSLDDILRDREKVAIFGRDAVSTYTFFHKDYIRRVWGRYLDVVEIRSRWAPGSNQSAVIMVQREHSTARCKKQPNGELAAIPENS